MTRVALVQARMGSSRFAGKVLATLAGRPVLDWVVTAAQAIPGIDKVAVAAPRGSENDVIADWCAARDVACHRGSESDVLERIRAAAEAENADIIVRLTADCPFLDPDVCGQVLLLLERAGADYASNVDPPRWPDGLDCEALTYAALEAAAREATRASEREHVTPFVRDRRQRFRIVSLACPIPGLDSERWTLDTADDLVRLERIAAHLESPPHSYVAVLQAIDSGAEEKLPIRNAGFEKSLVLDTADPPDYSTSQKLLDRARKTIPLGTQTFSKSADQWPQGSAPLFLSHGDGGRVWDVDGNRYVDLVCGLLPVVLGYRDPDVDAAIAAQLANGISFSLATDLEIALAERLVEIIPCAEMVRFGKNGSDATAAAVRLARAHTGRDRIAVSGYHGWQDWYIGSTTRNLGVPEAVCALTYSFPAGDYAALDTLLRRHPGEFAAIVVEPMSALDPGAESAQVLADLVHHHGALLVFDEIITGFRYAMGGVQELIGVTPDLACFGKAMANGMPLSAVVGRAEIMHGMEEIFFSTTFGGETLSLAAAIAVIDKMRREPVIETLWRTGERLARETRRLIATHGLEDVLTLRGEAPWIRWEIAGQKDARQEAIRTLLISQMATRGVLTLGSHNLCYAHNDADIELTLAAYDGTFGALRAALDGGRLEAELPCPVIEPVFRVRG